MSPSLERHLHRLAQLSPLLADLSQADVLVMTPTNNGFSVRSHVRPMNARTVYPIDQVGTTLASADRPLVSRAYETGALFDGGVWLARARRWIRTLAVPIHLDGATVGVLAREFSPSVEVHPGDQELLSFSTFRRFAAMIAAGSFPFRAETRRHGHPPRVGDGLMLFDAAGCLEYASPNALTVLRQVGASDVNVGHRLGDMGVDAPGMRHAWANRLDYTDEVEVALGVLSTWSIPLLDGEHVTGALVLVRNITELRQRDRMLLTKDATIAEIHHRVKNSLQTASSLLQLQARRTESDDARAALSESARRIRSIGVVHEMLSHSTDDEVQFSEVLSMLTSVIRDSLLDPGKPVRFEVDSDPAILPSKMTTPLALIASELIQNALDHAQCTKVRIGLRTQSDAVVLEIADDGIGFPPGFSVDDSDGLGLTIVRTMAESELRGSLTIDSATSVGTQADPGDGEDAGCQPGQGGRVTVRVPLFHEQGDPQSLTLR